MEIVENLKEQVAIITGSGRGIGAETAKLLASKGVHVILFSRNQCQLEKITLEIREHGGMADFVVGDVSEEEDVNKLFDRAIQIGKVTILVNNAGAIVSSLVEDLTLQQWNQVMSVNLTGMFLCSRSFFQRAKLQNKNGVVVNVSSLAGIRGLEKFPGYSVYTTSKHGVIGMTEALAVEGKKYQIAVNAIAPGAVDTQMLKSAAPHLKTETKAKDIAESILFLIEQGLLKKMSGTILEIHSNA